MSVSPSQWYQDHDQLLSALRGGGGAGLQRPIIRGYDDFRELGRGGQGIVFSAVQQSTRRKVAVKVLLDGAWASQTRRKRFEREVDLIASLRHPNIVRLYDSGLTEHGFPYYVMDFIEGTGLDEVIGGASEAPTRSSTGANDVPAVEMRDATPTERPDVRDAVALFLRVCEAVNYAHQRGVIHRDLKPSNIRIDQEGVPFVLDFGLAKSAEDPYRDSVHGPPLMSLTGEFMGSPPWASPEQAEGDARRMDVRSDVYSLGVILYQMLTRDFPYPVTGSLREVLNNIKAATPQRPSSIRRDLDDELDTILLKCLAKDPDRRYQSAGELARDLRHYLNNEPIEAKRESALYTLRKSMQRYRVVVRAGATVLVTMGVASVLLLSLWLRAERAESQARATYKLLEDVLTAPTEKGEQTLIVDVLDEGVRKLENNQRLRPETRATLHRAFGNAYVARENAKGLVELSAALQIWQELEGDDSENTKGTQADLAWAYYTAGDYATAQALLNDSLDWYARAPGAHTQTVLRIMRNLAAVQRRLGRLDRAERLLREVLATLRSDPPDAPADTVHTMWLLGAVLLEQRKLDEADEHLTAALTLGRDALHDKEIYLLQIVSDLGRLRALQGRCAEAIELSTEAYERSRAARGADHRETVAKLKHLADALKQSGRLKEAAMRYVDVLAASENDPLGQFLTHCDLALVLAVLANHDGADRSIQAARERAAELRSAELASYADVVAAKCLQQCGRYDEAAAAYQRLLAAYDHVDPENADQVALLEASLGATLSAAGQLDEADRRLVPAAAELLRLYGPTDLDALRGQLELAKLRLRQGDAAAATEILAELVPAFHEQLPRGHWLAAVAQGWYGRALLAAGERGGAAERLQAALADLEAALGQEHPDVCELRELVKGLRPSSGAPAAAEAPLPG